MSKYIINSKYVECYTKIEYVIPQDSDQKIKNKMDDTNPHRKIKVDIFMRKKILSMLIILCMMVSFLPTMQVSAKTESIVWDRTVAESFAGGDGSEGNPFQT